MIVHVGKNDIMIEKDKFEVLHIEKAVATNSCHIVGSMQPQN